MKFLSLEIRIIRFSTNWAIRHTTHKIKKVSFSTFVKKDQKVSFSNAMFDFLKMTVVHAAHNIP
jgi:N-methylhydantoinase B/oxoprolinase/acetone carboxylase alpha subunit